ncbi:polysaccharide biosynthesis C-terminal domain-containing protein [Siccirubricoccus sp. G192]|nr:polysaccharide biosynthesis C-terminal domain-containing protein [Siccirubricoccus sp. G192]
MVGVFGVFDFGVGQALTRALSERIGEGREAEATSLVGAALAALVGFSMVAALALWWLVPLLVERVLRVPPELQAQAVSGMRVLTAAAPLVVLNAALWGVLAAYQRFRAANLVTIPVSIFYYLGPVLVLLAWDSLTAVMLALVACRLANTLSYAWLVRPLLPGLFRGWPRLALVGPLLRIGGWMTFSGTLTQALLYADRFLIGALLSLAAVAYYATPLDLVLRVWILPVAVAQTLLPAFASAFATLPQQTAALLRRGALVIMALVFPACLLLVGAGREILWLWLGADFAEGGARVLQILGVGIFFSCAAFAPASLLDAIGRPDVTARFALAQAVLFLPLAAALLLLGFGIEGAALAWALRVAVDCGGKLLLAARFYPPAAVAARRLAAPLAGGGLGLALLLAMPGLPALLVAGTLALGLFGLLALRALEGEERGRMLGLLRHPGGLLRLGGGA